MFAPLQRTAEPAGRTESSATGCVSRVCVLGEAVLHALFLRFSPQRSAEPASRGGARGAEQQLLCWNLFWARSIFDSSPGCWRALHMLFGGSFLPRRFGVSIHNAVPEPPAEDACRGAALPILFIVDSIVMELDRRSFRLWSLVSCWRRRNAVPSPPVEEARTAPSSSSSGSRGKHAAAARPAVLREGCENGVIPRLPCCGGGLGKEGRGAEGRDGGFRGGHIAAARPVEIGVKKDVDKGCRRCVYGE